MRKHDGGGAHDHGGNIQHDVTAANNGWGERMDPVESAIQYVAPWLRRILSEFLWILSG